MSIEPPLCRHEKPCKIARVRKSGPNTGKFFFACAGKAKRRCRVSHAWLLLLQRQMNFDACVSLFCCFCEVVILKCRVTMPSAKTSWVLGGHAVLLDQIKQLVSTAC